MVQSLKSVRGAVVTFVRDEEGATAAEYGMIVALIAAIIIGVVGQLGTKISTAFNTVVTKM